MVHLLLGSVLLSAGFVSCLSAAMCQLDKNCNQIDKPFDKSIVCQRPETFLSLPPQFIAEPSDKVATQTDSSVTFQCAISTVSDYQVNFSWKLNGIHIEANSQDFSISSEFFSSTLEVQVSNVTEGIYQCVVYNEQLKYNVTSRYGYLTVEDCSDDGWIDTLLPSSNSHSSTVDLMVPKGSTTILECTSNVALSSSYTIWLRNKNATLDSNHVKLPNGALLVTNFDPPLNQMITFRCVVVSSSCPQQLIREFHLRATDEEPSPVVPSNQTAVPGSSVSLYCITNGKASNTWYKDGQILGSMSSWAVFGHLREVLVLSNVTMEMEGEYSCVDDDNTIMIAKLNVLTPPTLASIQVMDHTTDNLFLILPSSVDTLTLVCTIDHQTELTFTWFFRGNQITTVSPMGVVFTQVGPLLNVSDDDLYGSYQCVAANKGGSTAALLFVIKDKPNPPSSITMIRDGDLNVSRATSSYLYSITVHPPDNQLTHKELYTYTVEAYIYRNSDAEYSLCLCNYTSQSNVVVNFSANLFAGLQSKYFYIRAAVVSSTDGVSDFQPYYVNNSTCGSEINLVAPPPPTNLVWSSTPAIGGWNELLTWMAPNDYNYPSDLFKTHLTLQCKGLETLYEIISSDMRSYQVANTLPCCTACNYTLSFVTLDSRFSSSATVKFKTSSIRPAQPLAINSVQRNSLNSGRKVNINITLPPRNVSCEASEYTVLYSGQESPLQPLDECQLVTEPDVHSAGRYICAVDVETQFCWQALNFSAKLHNDGGWSDKSSPMELPGISKDMLFRYSTLEVADVTPTTMTVSLRVSNGLDCLLTNAPFTANVCISPSPSNSQSCSSVLGPAFSHTFTDLNWNTDYSIKGKLTVLDVQNMTLRSVKQVTAVGVPPLPPRNLSIILVDGVEKLLLSWVKPDGFVTQYNVSIVDSSGGNMQYNVTGLSTIVDAPSDGVKYLVSVSACTSVGCGPIISQYFPTIKLLGASQDMGLSIIVGVAVGSTVVIVIVIVVLITICVVCCMRKYRRKNNDNYEALNRQTLYNSREDLTDDDLVSVGGPDGAASVHSDRTILDKLDTVDSNEKVRDYLRDADSALEDETRDKEDDTELLIQSEQPTNGQIVTQHHIKSSPRHDRVSNFGSDYLTHTSPLDAAANLSPNRFTPQQDCISMHSLCITAGFIGPETLLVEKSLDSPFNQSKQYNRDTVASSSDNFPLPNTNQSQMDQEDVSESDKLMPQSSSGGNLGDTKINLELQLSTDGEQLECGVNNNTSRDYVSLPPGTFYPASSSTPDLLDDLSQGSSVFDDSIVPAEVNGSHFRSTASSGVYSTSSISNGYVADDVCRRSSSEGYISARTTPGPSDKQFTYNAISQSREQLPVTAMPLSPNFAHNRSNSGELVTYDYMNTQDLNLNKICMTMDEETISHALKPVS